MKYRGLLVGAPILGISALLFPISPIYFPNLINRHATYKGYSVRDWIKNLDSPDLEMRTRAIFALGAIGRKAPESVPALAAIVQGDAERTARIEAALALSKMAPVSRAAVPALTRALEDNDPFVRHNATVALLALGTDARAAVPALLKAFRNKANQTNLGVFAFTIQQTTVVALGRTSAGTDEAVPALVDALKNAATEEMQMAAARAVGEIGAPARSAALLLRALLKHRSHVIRETARDALESIDAPPQDTLVRKK